jgi:hypothetical protein
MYREEVMTLTEWVIGAVATVALLVIMCWGWVLAEKFTRDQHRRVRELDAKCEALKFRSSCWDARSVAEVRADLAAAGFSDWEIDYLHRREMRWRKYRDKVKARR